MDQPPHPGVAGPAGRRLHIAHRRSPSEMTPLLSKTILTSFNEQTDTRHCAMVSRALADLYSAHSGTTCFAATDRASPATTAADIQHASAICEHGHDTFTTTVTYCELPASAGATTTSDYGRHVPPCKRFSISSTAPTTAIGCPNECSYTAGVTSSEPVSNPKHGHGATSSSFLRGLWLSVWGLQSAERRHARS